ncbi:protein of unknown function [Burkholderia multivorans]
MRDGLVNVHGFQNYGDFSSIKLDAPKSAVKTLVDPVGRTTIVGFRVEMGRSNGFDGVENRVSCWPTAARCGRQYPPHLRHRQRQYQRLQFTPKQPSDSHRRVFSKSETAMNGAAALSDGALALAQALDNHDIRVVSRPQHDPRFIANGNTIASRQPDRPHLQSAMICNQISRTWHRQNVLHRRAFTQRRDTHTCVGVDGQCAGADILRITARQCNESALATSGRTDSRRAARCTGRCAWTEPDLELPRGYIFLVALGVMDRCAGTHHMDRIGDQTRAIAHVVFVRDGARTYPRDDLDVAVSMRAVARVRREFNVVPHVERTALRMIGEPGFAHAEMLAGVDTAAPDCAKRKKGPMFNHDGARFEYAGRGLRASKTASSAPTRPSHAQICCWPPSTNNSMPFTKLASSEARNSAALAISPGSPRRPIGIWAAR